MHTAMGLVPVAVLGFGFAMTLIMKALDYIG